VRVLVVDDQPDVREALALLLGDEGFDVESAADPGQALQAVGARDFALVLFDMNYSRDTTSGREGLALLDQLRELDRGMPLVAMTAWGSIDLAVEAIKKGASDFLEKPWDNNRLLSIIRTQLELADAADRAERLSRASDLERADRLPDGIVAESAGMRRVLELARQVAASDASVLITGENGVGKGLIAEQIHRWSPLADEVFVSVNMGSIPESLFEAEMFGHARGAFTDAHESRPGRFELADGGTLFLDEVGNLPIAQQAKMLRVLETGQFERVGERRTRTSHVRIVAATNADLPAMVTEGQFRRDLYFRLNTIEIDVPPLSRRPEDVLPLAEHFLARFRRKYRREIGFSDDARGALAAHRWPGNVRELAHAIERAVLLSGDGSRIRPEHLMLQPDHARHDADLVQPLEALEREAIEQAVARYNGDVAEAARALGLSRSAMYRRLDKYDIATRSDTAGT
jgi:DNA-binding NtrC family response regulator